MPSCGLLLFRTAVYSITGRERHLRTEHRGRSTEDGAFVSVSETWAGSAAVEGEDARNPAQAGNYSLVSTRSLYNLILSERKKEVPTDFKAQQIFTTYLGRLTGWRSILGFSDCQN